MTIRGQPSPVLSESVASAAFLRTDSIPFNALARDAYIWDWAMTCPFVRAA